MGKQVWERTTEKGTDSWKLKEDRKLKDELSELDTKDERAALFIVMLILSALNTAVMTLAPAYVVYRRILDDYPFISRFELHTWMFPLVVLSIVAGTAVFVVVLTLYVKFHNAINGKLGDYWSEG